MPYMWELVVCFFTTRLLCVCVFSVRISKRRNGFADIVFRHHCVFYSLLSGWPHGKVSYAVYLYEKRRIFRRKIGEWIVV